MKGKKGGYITKKKGRRERRERRGDVR